MPVLTVVQLKIENTFYQLWMLFGIPMCFIVISMLYIRQEIYFVYRHKILNLNLYIIKQLHNIL